jgi:cell volume regulation protein A
LFNVVFFIVITSALLQGVSLPIVAPIESVDTELLDLIVPYKSAVSGKSIVEIDMPEDSLIVLISRNENFIVPSGGTIFQEGDTVLVLVNKNNLSEVRTILAKQKLT